jgi:hypothetical protein
MKYRYKRTIEAKRWFLADRDGFDAWFKSHGHELETCGSRALLPRGVFSPEEVFEGEWIIWEGDDDPGFTVVDNDEFQAVFEAVQ